MRERPIDQDGNQTKRENISKIMMFREKIAGGTAPTLYQASTYGELSQNNGNRLRNDVG
jgi:hypothetical protein